MIKVFDPNVVAVKCRKNPAFYGTRAKPDRKRMRMMF